MNTKNKYKVSFLYQKFNNEWNVASIDATGNEELYKKFKANDKKLATFIEQKGNFKKVIIVEIS